ncbi:MAG: hypothetical protein IT370_13800 [Deltaproteobacteria bacterium]|nr:hypothetical protein [Deltaproteobacteria bacterium]
MRKAALLFVAAGLLLQSTLAAAGTPKLKWVKLKWQTPEKLKGTYMAPKGWTIMGESSEANPRYFHLEQTDGRGNADLEYATVGDNMTVEQRARWGVVNPVVTTKGGWTCAEGLAGEEGSTPQPGTYQVVRCAKAIKGGGILLAAMQGDAEHFKALGGQKALRAALKALTGMRGPGLNES